MVLGRGRRGNELDEWSWERMIHSITWNNLQELNAINVTIVGSKTRLANLASRTYIFFLTNSRQKMQNLQNFHLCFNLILTQLKCIYAHLNTFKNGGMDIQLFGDGFIVTPQAFKLATSVFLFL